MQHVAVEVVHSTFIQNAIECSAWWLIETCDTLQTHIEIATCINFFGI